MYFAEEHLDNVYKSSTTMNGSCNAGITKLNTKGRYGNFEFWLNKRGIANFLSIPMLESIGYKVSTHTDRDCVVINPDGKRILFKRDTGLCKGMPYIDLRKNHLGVTMIETVQKNFESFTKKEIERAKLARVVHHRI